MGLSLRRLGKQIGDIAGGVERQINPLDAGLSYKTKVVAPQQAQQSTVQQAYNNFIKPTIQLPVQFSENYSNTFANIGNRLAGAPNQTIQRNMGGSPALDKTLDFSGATGKNAQLAGDVAQIGVAAAAPGASRFAAPVTSKLIPTAAPKIISTLAPKVVGDAAVGGGFNAASVAGNGGDVKDVAKAFGQGAAAGAILPVAGEVGKGAAKVSLKAPQAVEKSLTPRTTLNDQRTLAELSDHLTGVKPLTPGQLSANLVKSREIAQKHGQLESFVKGSPEDRLNGVNNLLDSVVQRGKTQADMGGAKAGDIFPNRVFSKPDVTLKQGVSPAKNGNLQVLKQGLSDKDQVILDELRSIEKQTGQKGLVDKFMYNSNMQRGSNAGANVALQTSPNVEAAIGGLGKKDYQNFSDYANARAELSTATDGKRTSRPIEDLKAQVASATPEFQQRFEALNAHYKDLADKALESGLISPETHAKYVANNDYIRIQRDMGDLLPPAASGRGNGYSIGKTVLDQTRKGSRKDILPAGETAADYTQRIYREAAKNKTGTHLVDTLEKNGLAKQLVNSEDVLARRAAFSKLKELKPVRDALAKETSVTTKQLKELVNRNKSLSPQILDQIQSSSPEVRNNAIKLANNVDRAINRPSSKRISKGISEADVSEAFQQYLDGNPALVRKMYEFIGNKAEAERTINKLDGLKAQFEAVKKERGDTWLTAKQHTDKITANRNTVSILRNGIRETYEVSPQIKEAIQNINPYQMNAVMQVLAAPGRVLRAGVTGLNPVFIARNLVKDQAGSAINSEALRATHNPAAFFSGLFNASKEAIGANHDPLYQDFLRHYGDQTSYDLTRNVKDTQAVVNRIRGGKKVGFAQAIKSPIRTAENTASITEKSTRFQNYRGAYKRAISEGLPPEQASEKAAIAAWQNSVDFSRAGTWGRVINSVIPYWNPATQGVRQMTRTFTKHPVKSSFTGAALVGLPIASATAWNLSNPDTAQVYKNIPEYEKDNNLILIPPGTKQNKDGSYDVVKIPLPPGYKDAFMPIRRALESYHDKKPLEGGKIAQDILQTIGGPVNTQSIGGFAGSFLPQAAKPLVQQYANKDLFTGKTIVPDYVNEAKDAQGNNIPENKKAYQYSSGTARTIGNTLGVSPIRVEKFIKDSAGTVGLNALNAVDTLRAKRGDIPSDQVGGQSVQTGFKRSFGSAQGIDNANKSEGAKYFESVKQATAKLNGNEQAAFNSLHPAKKNFLGDTISEMDSTYNPAARLDIYNRYPKVFAADKALDAKSQKSGNPGNPLFALEPWQVKKVLEKDNLPAGAKDPELSKLRDQDWYADYSTKKSAYFSALSDKAAKAGKPFAKSDNPYPATPPDLQKTMDYYSSIPKGTGARSAWIKGNPGQWKSMQDQFARIDNWQNLQRGKRGLDATEGDTGVAAGYGTSSGSSKYGGSSSSTSLDPYKYAVSLNAGGTIKRPKVTAHLTALPKAKKAVASKPKVALKKSKV